MDYAVGSAMGLLVSVLIGALIGWLASIVMKTTAQMGSLANIAVGIVGSALGGWVAGLLGFAPSSVFGAILVAIIGACLLIAILKAVGVLK